MINVRESTRSLLFSTGFENAGTWVGQDSISDNTRQSNDDVVFARVAIGRQGLDEHWKVLGVNESDDHDVEERFDMQEELINVASCDLPNCP